MSSYASIDQIRARLGSADSNADDATLQTALDWATRFIDERCDRVFDSSRSSGAPRYYTRHATDSRHPHLLYLDGDCLSVALLTNGDGTVITSDKYVLEPRNAPTFGQPYYAIRILQSAGAMWVWPVDGWVQVVGEWAFSSEADDEIVGACLRLAEWFYRSRAPLTTTSIFDGSVQKETPEGFPTEVLVLLDQRARLAA